MNEVAADGIAALHAAAQQGNLETLARLLEAGAHRGVRDKYGRRADQVRWVLSEHFQTHTYSCIRGKIVETARTLPLFVSP